MGAYIRGYDSFDPGDFLPRAPIDLAGEEIEQFEAGWYAAEDDYFADTWEDGWLDSEG